MKTTLYDILGVKRTATRSEIKSAYRNLARRTHPDAGGDAEAFTRIAKAFEVLYDPARRQRYDETGALEEPVDPTSVQALGLLSDLLADIMSADAEPFCSDVVDLIRLLIVKQVETFDAGIAKFERAKARIAKMKGRFKRKTETGDGENIFEAQLRTHQVILDRAIEQATRRRQVCEYALTLLADYQFWQDAPIPFFGFNPSSTLRAFP
jgi:curved DNA-binding protein CbpA